MTLEEFGQLWHEILHEKYNKLKNENQEGDKKETRRRNRRKRNNERQGIKTNYILTYEK